MKTANVYEAKTHLSRLLERAEAGEEIIITRHGRPVARLGPVRVRKQPRELGLLRGRIRMAKDFDEPLPDDVLAAFEGRSA
jgi:prevent-host-death family protein